MSEQTAQPSTVTAPHAPFTPIARYNKELEFLYFVRENMLSYRAEMVDDLLEVLWHPEKTEIIGINIHIPAWGLKGLQTEGESTPVSHILDAVYALVKANYPESTRRPLDILYRAARKLVGNTTLAYQVFDTAEPE